MTPVARKAVALLSGGLDSSVAMALAIKEGTQVILALTVDYGQRAAGAESDHARRIARHFGVSHRTGQLPWFRDIGRGGLFDGRDLPEPTATDLNCSQFTSQSAKAVWVPNRNGVLIEMASAFAESLGAEAVIVGFNLEEAATFPDNSKDYMHAVSRALAYSTANQVEVISPTASLDKREIVARGKEMQFPFDLIWSCYVSGDRMCGRCESCMRLKRAFASHQLEFDEYFHSAQL